MKTERVKSIAGILIIISLFVFFSYLIQTNLEFFQSYFNVGFFGMFIFIVIVAISIVLAPVSSVPLFPLGSGLWGWVITAILAVVGWTMGAVIAFILARKYGVALVKKLLPIKKIYQFEKKISDENVFWTLVFLRMIIPIDGVSYLFGLFSKMSLKAYTLATIIGLIPFSFMVVYLGTIPFYYQIFVLSIGLIIFILGLLISYHKKKNGQ